MSTPRSPTWPSGVSHSQSDGAASCVQTGSEKPEIAPVSLKYRDSRHAPDSSALQVVRQGRAISDPGSWTQAADRAVPVEASRTMVVSARVVLKA